MPVPSNFIPACICTLEICLVDNYIAYHRQGETTTLSKNTKFAVFNRLMSFWTIKCEITCISTICLSLFVVLFSLTAEIIRLYITIKSLWFIEFLCGFKWTSDIFFDACVLLNFFEAALLIFGRHEVSETSWKHDSCYDNHQRTVANLERDLFHNCYAEPLLIHIKNRFNGCH